MMTSTKDVLKSIMEEVNLNPRIQNQLLSCADSGKSFPFVPKSLTENRSVSPKYTEVPSNLKLPSRPIQRPKSTIEKLGTYERDQFRPDNSKTRPTHEKQRLQNMMAYGKDIDEEIRNLSFVEESNDEEGTPVDMFTEILKEIKERREFLDDMTELGDGKKYLPEIQSQIALRLRELEKIDKKRAEVFMRKYGM